MSDKHNSKNNGKNLTLCYYPGYFGIPWKCEHNFDSRAKINKRISELIANDDHVIITTFPDVSKDKINEELLKYSDFIHTTDTPSPYELYFGQSK